MLLGMKRVLVTGGAGFIGSNFLHWLARNTDASWTVLDSLTYAGNLASFEGLPSERHAFVEGSVADLDLVSELVEAQTWWFILLLNPTTTTHWMRRVLLSIRISWGRSMCCRR